MRTTNPPIGRIFDSYQEISVRAGLRGGGRSHSRTCLPPANSLLTGKLTGNFVKFTC